MNSMIPRESLIEIGFGKAVQRFDDHEASREGLGYRDLSPPVIRQHFEDIGLDGDIADHTPLGSLSGGQLVKVVIAGAMWNNPIYLFLMSLPIILTVTPSEVLHMLSATGPVVLS